MFAAPKKIEDNKLEKPVNPFIVTLEQKKQLDELDNLKKEENELKKKLTQIEAQISATRSKLDEFAQKSDIELEELLKKKMPAIGVYCHANLERKIIAIKLYPVENLEVVKNVFHSFVDPKSIKISNKPLDGTFISGGPNVFIEMDINKRADLLKGLQLSQADLDIPMSHNVMRC